MNLKEFGWEKEVPFKIKCNNNKQDDIYIHMSWTVVKQNKVFGVNLVVLVILKLFRLMTNKKPGKKQLSYKMKIVQVVDIKQ